MESPSLTVSFVMLLRTGPVKLSDRSPESSFHRRLKRRVVGVTHAVTSSALANDGLGTGRQIRVPRAV